MKPIKDIKIDTTNGVAVITVPLDGECKPSASGKTYHMVAPGTRPAFEIDGVSIRASVMLFGSEDAVNALTGRTTRKASVASKRAKKATAK